MVSAVVVKTLLAETIWPDETFNEEQRQQLMEEPLLHVVVLESPEPEENESGSNGGKRITAALLLNC